MLPPPRSPIASCSTAASPDSRSSIAAWSSFDFTSAFRSTRRRPPWDPCRDREVPTALRDRGSASSARGRRSTAVAGGERMNAGPDVERRISDWLAEEVPTRAPDRILPATFERSRQTRQRHLGAAWRTLADERHLAPGCGGRRGCPDHRRRRRLARAAHERSVGGQSVTDIDTDPDPSAQQQLRR